MTEFIQRCIALVSLLIAVGVFFACIALIPIICILEKMGCAPDETPFRLFTRK